MSLLTFAGLVAAGHAVLPVAAQTAQTAQKAPVPDGVGVDERLGERVALDAVFMDESGSEVRISDLMDSERPVILNFVYHECPMLCSLLLDGFTDTLQQMAFAPGAEFDVITVSFSASETPELAARQKERYLASLDAPSAADGWHFLTGTEEEIGRLAESTGFRFRWVGSQEQFAHPAALIFLAPDGTITRYLHGMTFAAADVRRALVEASNGTVGSAVDRVLLYCFQYDPGANSYVLHATNLMKLGGLLTLLVLGAGLFLFFRRERERQHSAPDRWPAPESA